MKAPKKEGNIEVDLDLMTVGMPNMIEKIKNKEGEGPDQDLRIEVNLKCQRLLMINFSRKY